MRPDRYLEVTSSGPKPGKEKEYNEWYHKHITELFAFGGLKRVSRSKLYWSPKEFDPPRYLVIYEFESKEDITAFYAHPLMEEAKRHYLEDSPSCVEMAWAGFYEPLETYEKEA